jgi:hypothetical protein
MTYGIPALDAVRKFSNEARLFLAKLLDFLHLCMGEDIHKINTNLILLTGPAKNQLEPLIKAVLIIDLCKFTGGQARGNPIVGTIDEMFTRVNPSARFVSLV